MKRKIVLLATGGTIASIGDPSKGNVVASLQGEDILRKLTRSSLPDIQIEVKNFCTTNSVNLGPAEMIQLALEVKRLLDQSDVSGVVITHGTSLMEETAFVLDTLISSDKPVVITGAQLNASCPWSDGLANLNDAIHVAASRDAYGRGVMIVFCGKIHPGRYATKKSTCSLDAFDSGDEGIIGTVYFDQVTFIRKSSRKTLSVQTVQPVSVSIIPFYSGANADYLRHAMEIGEAGVVIEGVGLGNVNREYFEAIKELRTAGIHVVITTRCPSGKILPIYAYDGGAASLRKLGVIFSSLPSSKARLMLLMIMGTGGTPEDMRAYFD